MSFTKEFMIDIIQEIPVSGCVCFKTLYNERVCFLSCAGPLLGVSQQSFWQLASSQLEPLKRVLLHGAILCDQIIGWNYKLTASL